MAIELPMVRRVVCENNREGKSVIVQDGPPKHVRSFADHPGFRVCNLWATFGSPAPIGDPDRSTEIKGILPPLSESGGASDVEPLITLSYWRLERAVPVFAVFRD